MTTLLDVAGAATQWWTWVGLSGTILAQAGARVLRERSRRKTLEVVLRHTQPGALLVDQGSTKGDRLVSYREVNEDTVALVIAPAGQQP